jgi:hypothetical protein
MPAPAREKAIGIPMIRANTIAIKGSITMKITS